MVCYSSDTIVSKRILTGALLVELDTSQMRRMKIFPTLVHVITQFLNYEAYHFSFVFVRKLC